MSRRLIGEGGSEVRKSRSALVPGGQLELLRPARGDRILEEVRKLFPREP